MGGRGSLSRKVHKMFNKESILAQMKEEGIEIRGLNNINNSNLSFVVETLENVARLNKKYGKYIDSISIGGNSSTIYQFIEDYKPYVKGKQVDMGRTLVISSNYLKKGREKTEREIRKKYNSNQYVARTISQMVSHEFGNAVYSKFRKSKAYNYYTKEVDRILKNKNANTYLSDYARTKGKDGKVSYQTYFAEGFTHLDRGTKTRRGEDMLDTIKRSLKKDDFDFSKYTQSRNTKVRKLRPKRKRK